MTILHLPFRPLLKSPHLQTILAHLCSPGPEPKSKSWRVSLEGGDSLCCEVSTPAHWPKDGKCVVLVHGLGGSHNSRYMVRLARKLYTRGCKVVRVNLRGCGSGRGLSKLPYNAGTSEDVKAVLVALKREQPESETILVGFSLGGNIVVKLAGELGESAERLLTKSIAVCPPLDLAKAVRLIEKKENRLYHSHYVKTISKQARCFSSQVVSSLYEFDDKITAPLWGYKSAHAYYQDASGLGFLSKIQHPCSLLFAMDDPFVSFDFEREALSSNVQIYATQHGGHMGFLGKAKGHFYHWLDYQLLEWIILDSAVGNGQ